MTQTDGQRPRLLTAGYLTLDLIVRDLDKRHYWQSAGGTCGNVSVFASALGADVSVLARVGEDHRGRLLLDYLNNEGIDTSGVERIEELCTPGIVEHIYGASEGTHRFSYRCPVCETQLPKHAVVSWRRAKVEAKCIDRFDSFFFDRATPATLHLAEAARKAGLLVMFEPPRIPRTDIAKRAAAFSDIIKVSPRKSNRGRVWDLNNDASTRFIIETLGASGVRVKTRTLHGWDEWREFPAIPQSHISDTAGAGDWLTAGLLTSLPCRPGLIGSDTMLASIQYGQKLSAISLAFDGPGGALAALDAPTIKETAKGVSPILFPSETCVREPQIRRNANLQMASHCELCLTAEADLDS